MRQISMLTALLTMCISSTIAGTNKQPALTSLSALTAARDSNRVSADQFALQAMKIIRTPQHALPTAEKNGADGEVTSPIPMCATAAILQIKQSWDSLSRSTRSMVTAALTRHTTDSIYHSASGFFTLHYNLTGPDAVTPDDADASLVPDFIEKVAAYMDSSLAKHRALGFLDPPSDGLLGGDSTFDVYFEDMGAYGYAVPEGIGPNPWPGEYSYLVLHRNFIGFPPDNDPEGNIAGAAKATCAHEFHHCVQFAYDPNEAIWLMELDATAMEDLVYDATDDNYNYLNTYFTDPEISLMATTGHMYSSFIWHSYLAQRYDTSLMVQLWEGARTGTAFQSLEDSLIAHHGVTRDSAFTEFASWLYLTSTRADGTGFTEAANYPLVSIDRIHSFFPVASQLSPKSPAGYASCWVEAVTAGIAGNMRIDFDGNDARQWAAVVILSKGLNQHEVRSIPLSGPGYAGSITIDSIRQYSRIALAGINLTESSSASTFTYGFVPTYTVSIDARPKDSGMYAGGTHPMKVYLRNFLSVDQVISAVFIDSAGWVPKDSVVLFVPHLDSTVTSVPITAPAGLPLGSSHPVYGFLRSLSDTTQHVALSFKAATTVQRGDLNFDGAIDIADLTWCVGYLFLSGPDPIPNLTAGDFDCNPGVDIADLTLLVDHLFIGFANSPCQPD